VAGPRTAVVDGRYVSASVPEIVSIGVPEIVSASKGEGVGTGVACPAPGSKGDMVVASPIVAVGALVAVASQAWVPHDGQRSKAAESEVPQVAHVITAVALQRCDVRLHYRQISTLRILPRSTLQGEPRA
jgi:hypothetical protein